MPSSSAGYHRLAPESHRVILSVTGPAGCHRRTWTRAASSISTRPPRIEGGPAGEFGGNPAGRPRVKADMERLSRLALMSGPVLGLGLTMAACGAAGSGAQPTTPSSGASSAGPASAGPAASGVGVIADCIVAPHGLTIRPAAITLACADNGLGLENLTWASWTAASATGRGTLRENLCQPSCADGKTGTYPVAVILSAVRISSQGPWFSRVTFTWTGTRPPDPPENPLPLPPPIP
jgi:hypothetical protein